MCKRWLAALALLCGTVAQATGPNPGCVAARDGRLVCPQPDARCVADRYGDVVCSTPGGGIVFDRYGEPVCGSGHCTTDRRGDVFCSSAARGAAAVDRFGNAACAVECRPARADACVRPKSVK